MSEIEFDRERINQYVKGEYNSKNEFYINELFCNSNKEKELKHLLSRQFYDLLDEDEVEKKDLDGVLYKIHYEINTRLAERGRRKLASFFSWSIKIAGIIILPLSIFWGIKGYFADSVRQETWVEIKAPAWTRAKFSLPDGTTGWLNSNSSIKYNGNFSIDRQVSLTGEAFFDVVKDSKRPFIVNTNEVEVKVLGTRFNVASYDNEVNVEVVLQEGSLIFNDKKKNKSYAMNPNDLITYDKINHEFTIEVVEPHKYSSWTEGKLVFRNDPLDVIAQRLERWYNIDVEVDVSHSDDIRLRGTFIDESLEEVLMLLKRSMPINYRIEDRAIKLDETYVKKKVIITNKPK